MNAIIKKELKSYFSSPIGYVYVGLILAMAGLFFYLSLLEMGSLNFEYLFADLGFFSMFIIPILTMRLFSEEKKLGTEQLLFTSPKSMFSIVSAKFISATILLLITEFGIMLYYVILLFFGTPELITTIGVLLGYLFLGMAYISSGMFISALTENQIIAAIMTLVFLVINLFMSEKFSVFAHFIKFTDGVVGINQLLFFIFYILLFFALTVLVLQKKKGAK